MWILVFFRINFRIDEPLTMRYRQLQVHVDDIPGIEWETILTERCGLPPSHCKLLVKVLHELQVNNSSVEKFGSTWATP